MACLITKWPVSMFLTIHNILKQLVIYFGLDLSELKSWINFR
jgi:hypothetical protein